MKFNFKRKQDNFDDFPPIGGLMVSKMVVDKKMKPRFMYREKRSRPEDSGWRIFTGLESQAYTDDPANAGIYNPSTILKIDASIKDLLLKGVGSVYERKTDRSEWYKVTDFKLEDDYMVTHKLTKEWTIVINNLFERKVEESGDLLYTTGDKSVRIAIWNELDKSKDEIYQDHKEIAENVKALRVFDLSDNSIAKVGFLIKENDNAKAYSVIYGYSIIDHQLIQAAFYFDEEDDLEWAIDTWKNISYGR